MNYQWNGWQGSRISGTVRRPSIRSAEAEERRRGHGVDDAGSAFRPHDRIRKPSTAVLNIINSHQQREKEAKRERGMTTTTWVTFLDELTRLIKEMDSRIRLPYFDKTNKIA